MKLFYHFLILVFVSLILVACARIFTSDSEIKTFNSQPSEIKQQQDHQADSVAQVDLKGDFPTITNFDYRSLLKTKRWTDNQCGFNSVFYIKNVQMVMNHLSRYAQ